MSTFRDWLNTLFGSDGGRAIQMLVALLLVVLLILAVTWLFRRMFGGMALRNRSPRLSVVDSTIVDHNRRLLLLRRDDVEHLVMIGGPNDVLVESRILRAAPTMAGRPVAPTARQQAPARMATPTAAPIAPSSATASAAPSDTVTGTPAARVAGGAAAMVAAVASAGALLRSRIARPEEPGETPVSPATSGEPLRRTLDQAFDAPLGRPASPPAPAVEALAPVAPVAPPVEAVVARPVPPPIMPPIDLTEPVAPVRAPSAAAPAAARPAPRTLDDIDLLADFDRIAAELSTPAKVEPTPSTPVAPAPVVPALDEPTLPFAQPLEEPTPRPVAAPEIEPVQPVAADPLFDFDFGFGKAPVAAPPAPPVAPARPMSVPDVAEPAPLLDEAPQIEIVRDEVIEAEVPVPPPASAEAAPAEAAPEITPPQPHAPTSVDELEEEMARLLSELSGQPRR